MAEELMKGTGILFGIPNNGTPISITGIATFILSDAKASHKFKLDTVDDENAADVTWIGTNPHQEIDITWTPSGATRAAAAATADFPAPLATIVLANFKVARFNGSYSYVGDGSIDLSHGPGKMSLKIRKYDDDDQNDLFATTVTG